MRLFARADGSLIATNMSIEPGDGPATLLPLIPEVPAETLDFDTDTNRALVDDIEEDFHVLRGGRFRVTAGVLTKNGGTITPAAPGRYIQDKQQIEQASQQLDTLLAKLDGGTDLTPAERQAAFRFILRALRFILRWIVRRG